MEDEWERLLENRYILRRKEDSLRKAVEKKKKALAVEEAIAPPKPTLEENKTYQHYKAELDRIRKEFTDKEAYYNSQIAALQKRLDSKPPGKVLLRKKIDLEHTQKEYEEVQEQLLRLNQEIETISRNND